MAATLFPRSDESLLSVSNRIYIWATGLAVIFGAIALVATKGVQKYSERLGAMQKNQIEDTQAKVAIANRDVAQANQRIAEAQVQTERARADAARAVEGQKSLEVEAERARTKQKELELQISESRKVQEELRKRNIELQSSVETEKTARIKLELRLAPRGVTSEQRDQLIAALQPLRGQPLLVTVTAGYESERFADELLSAFSAAGIIIHRESVFGTGAPPIGITFEVSPGSEHFARILAAALVGAGISPPPIKATNSATSQLLNMVIGIKP